MHIVIITGTPGTGKTDLAGKICKRFNLKNLDVGQIIRKHADGYDSRRKTKIIDIRKLTKALIKEIEHHKKLRSNGMVIDSHLSHYLPKKYVDLCIVTKCNLKDLKKRLQKRKYSKAKIRENVDAEIFDVCSNEAKEIGHKPFHINTSKRFNIDSIFQRR